MRFVYAIMLMVIITINSFGCAAAPTTDTSVSEPSASSSDTSNTKEEVTIKANFENLYH